jgi:2-keto-4-pentenoate hydratase/2-oxohepta-3-ene-1,7-dioic acid hydratase in catechol pathway
MRFVAFSVQGEDRLGIERDGRIVDLSARTKQPLGFDVAFFDFTPDQILELADRPGPHYAPAEIQYRPAVSASATVFCAGLNYAKQHPVTGAVDERPPHPTIFLKTQDALVGHRETIEFPEGRSEQLDYEGELAVVIGRTGKNISLEDAYSHVAGYTVLNDGSVRDWQKHSLCSGKNFFASGSVGPFIVTRDEIDDPMNLRLTTRVNGTVVQNTNTSAMLWNIAELIHHVSRFTRLRAGDLLSTGSPEGSGASLRPPRFLRPGDEVEVEISGVGLLANKVGATR